MECVRNESFGELCDQLFISPRIFRGSPFLWTLLRLLLPLQLYTSSIVPRFLQTLSPLCWFEKDVESIGHRPDSENSSSTLFIWPWNQKLFNTQLSTLQSFGSNRCFCCCCSFCCCSLLATRIYSSHTLAFWPRNHQGMYSFG